MHRATPEYIGKPEINTLPLRQWEGPIVLIASAPDAQTAVAECQREPLLGFDTETRAAFRKGESYRPALLQLATADTVFLFQVQSPGVFEACQALMEDAAVVKAGVAVSDDLKQLQAIRPFSAHGFIELQDLSKRCGLRNHGLRGLAALLLGFRISKAAQTSNWEMPRLTERQLRYAATDAWASREIYLALHDLGTKVATASAG